MCSVCVCVCIQSMHEYNLYVYFMDIWFYVCFSYDLILSSIIYNRINQYWVYGLVVAHRPLSSYAMWCICFRSPFMQKVRLNLTEDNEKKERESETLCMLSSFSHWNASMFLPRYHSNSTPLGGRRASKRANGRVGRQADGRERKKGGERVCRGDERWNHMHGGREEGRGSKHRGAELAVEERREGSKEGRD